MPVNGFVESTSWVMPTVNTVFSAVPPAAGDGVPDSSALAGNSGNATTEAITPASAARTCHLLLTLMGILPVWPRVLPSGHVIRAPAQSKPHDGALGGRKSTRRLRLAGR